MLTCQVVQSVSVQPLIKPTEGPVDPWPLTALRQDVSLPRAFHILSQGVKIENNSVYQSECLKGTFEYERVRESSQNRHANAKHAGQMC